MGSGWRKALRGIKEPSCDGKKGGIMDVVDLDFLSTALTMPRKAGPAR